jgi:RNA polymerase sigma factor (sigma-70 family)
MRLTLLGRGTFERASPPIFVSYQPILKNVTAVFFGWAVTFLGRKLNTYIVSIVNFAEANMKELKSEVSDELNCEISDSHRENHRMLCQFFEDNAEILLGTLRISAWRQGIVRGSSVEDVSCELLSQVFIKAIESADTFDSSQPLMNWIWGIAKNLIKQKRDKIVKRQQREPLVRDLYQSDQETLSDDELFDRIASLSVAENGQALESNEQVAQMLALVSEPDQQILRLAVLHDMNGDEMAKTLDIKPATARQRFHRALKRLRHALSNPSGGEKQKTENRGGKDRE